MKPFKLVKDSSITFTLTNTGKPNSSSLSFPFLLMLLLLLVLVLVLVLVHCGNDVLWKGMEKFGKSTWILPYLLKDLSTGEANHVGIGSTDITYIPMGKGFIYLVAIFDWYSRSVISLEMERALSISQPQICNSDQGCQFTNPAFYQLLADKPIAVSMDGCGRAFDNIIIEGLWRSVKYEDAYLKGCNDVSEALRELGKYFAIYNNDGHHQSQGYKKPVEIYFQKEVYQEVSN